MIAALPAWRRAWTGRLGGVVAGCGLTALIAGNWIAMRLPADRAHPLTLTTYLYALVLAAGLLLLAAGTGRAMLRLLGVRPTSALTAWLFATVLGAGGVAYVVLALGLAGYLNAGAIAVALGLLAVAVRSDLAAALTAARQGVLALRDRRRSLRGQGRVVRLIVTVTEVLIVSLLVRSLVLPTSYDALMYHLYGPKRFLELGRLAVLPDVQQANMPFTVDMLFLVGLAFGSEQMAGALHLAFALLLALATFNLGSDLFDDATGAIAAVILLSPTLIAVYAPVANIDYALACFDLLAVAALVHWQATRDRGWLLVAGVLVGFALGTKYLGAITAVALGCCLLWMHRRSVSRGHLRELAAAVLAFAGPALLVAAPWYAKNWLWLGSPVWPFLAPGDPAFNIAVVSANSTFGRDPLTLLSVPFRLYTQGSLELSGARPPLLLLLLPLYALVPKRPAATALLALGGFYLAVWLLGAHVLRYLTSALPLFCLVVAYALRRLFESPRFGPRAERLGMAALAVSLAGTAGLAFGMAVMAQPFAHALGLESRDANLARQVPNYRLVTRLNQEADEVRGVLLIGDRRAYYLDVPTWVDVSVGAFERLATAPDPDAARAYLDELGVSHVLVSEFDLAWHASFDPDGHVRAWWQRFQRTHAAYLTVEATDGDQTLYRVGGRR